MKKLLSILAALGLTATSAASVVACGSGKNDKNQQEPLITGAYYNTDGKVAIVFDRDITFDVKASDVHINNGAEVQSAAVDATDKKVIDVVLKRALTPKRDTIYIVTVDGTRFTYGNAFNLVVKNSTPEPTDDKITWKTMKATADELNNISFSLDNAGKDVDLSVPPTIAYSKKGNGAFKNVLWDMGSQVLRMTLNDGLEKGDFDFYISFKLKSGNDSSDVQTMTVTKDKATEQESMVNFRNDNATNDPNNNKASWIWSNVGADVDLTKKPTIKAVGVDGEPIKDIELNVNQKKLTVTLVDGAQRGPIVLQTTFALKNGFDNNFPISLVLTKDKATPIETSVNWKSEAVSTSKDNEVNWTLKDDNYGAELDLENEPIISVVNPTRPIIANKEWHADSKTLSITLVDGLPKDDYKFNVEFKYQHGFYGTFKSVLTAKKDNPSDNEKKVSTSKPEGTANKTSGVTSDVTWDIDTFGVDVDKTKIAKATLDGNKQDISSGLFWTADIGKLQLNIGNNLKEGSHTLLVTFNWTNGFSGTTDIQLTFTI